MHTYMCIPTCVILMDGKRYLSEKATKCRGGEITPYTLLSLKVRKCKGSKNLYRIRVGFDIKHQNQSEDAFVLKCCGGVPSQSQQTASEACFYSPCGHIA